MYSSLEINKHITLGSTSMWLNTPFLLFLTKSNIFFSTSNTINKRNSLFIIVIFSTMIASVLNWNPINLQLDYNPYKKYDSRLAKILYVYILYLDSYNFTKKGISMPLNILLCFSLSRYYCKTANHFNHTLCHLTFRYLGFIWMIQLIHKNAYHKLKPISLFYWIHSFYLLFKYRNININEPYNTQLSNAKLNKIYYKECEYIYIYSIMAYFYSLKKLV